MIKYSIWPARYWKHIKNILFIFLWLILAACSFHEQYPPNWAPLVKASKDCSTITGIYNDDGSKKQPALSYVLTGIDVKLPDLDKTNYVHISKVDNDMLIVTALHDNTILAEKIYKKDDYICSDQGIEISKGAEVSTDWVLGLSWDKVTLIKASDGSLVVMYGSSGFGLFGALIPVAADEIKYYRYSPKK